MIGRLIVYFIAGQFVNPITLDKRHNYLIVTGSISDENASILHDAISSIVDGEVLVINGVELNIIGLADENHIK